MSLLERQKSRTVLVLGSRNRKKCREMAELIAPPWEANPWLAQLDIRSVDEFPGSPDVVEDATTFAGNARKKAAEVAKRSAAGCWPTIPARRCEYGDSSAPAAARPRSRCRRSLDCSRRSGLDAA